MKYAFLLLIWSVLLISCHSNKSNFPQNEVAGSVDTVVYAKGFSMTSLGKLKILNVYNPWEGAQNIVYTYVLCPKGEVVPDSLKKYTVIFTPVQRIVCLSTTHVALLSFFNKVNSIVGMASPQYVSNPEAIKLVESHKIVDVGYDQALNYEMIVSLKPDLVIAYGIQSETAGQFKKLENLGVKVVLNGEYLESTPLGKLEWVKFLAAFYNQSDTVTAEFKKVEKRYQSLKELGRNAKENPTVLCGLPWKGVWYVPGGDSYAAQIIQDAGGNYLWKDAHQRESLSLNFEKVLERGIKSDLWINTGTSSTLQNITAEDSRLSVIKAFKDRNVFNCNALTNPSGGNDFWESGIIKPDVILADLIKICHPQLLPDHSLVYYKKLD